MQLLTNLTSQNDCVVKVKDIIVGYRIEFALPHAKAVEENVNVTGTAQLFRIRVKNLQPLENKVDLMA